MLPFHPMAMDVAQQAWVAAHVEERARSGNDVSALETELKPLARYDRIWNGGQTHFVALYSPRFVYTRTTGEPYIDETRINRGALTNTDANARPFSALHNGGIGIEAIRRRWRLSAYQFAAYGPITTTSLLVQDPWAGEGQPAEPNPIIPSTIATRFTLLFAQTQVFVPVKVSPRVALIPSFTFNAFGGANSEARAAMALTLGPGGSVAVEVAATKNDRFVTTVGAGQVQTLFQGDRTGPNIYRAEARQSWRHWLREDLSTELEAGATIGGDAISGFSLYSFAEAGLLYDAYGLPKLAPGAAAQGAPPGRGARLQVGTFARVTPWLDLFSGELVQRGVAVFALNYGRDRTTFRLQVSGAHVLPTPRSIARYDIFQADTSVRYRFTRDWSGDVGVRFGAQDFDNAIRFNQTTQGQLFVGVGWAPQPARF
jgi:hypothetical protein